MADDLINTLRSLANRWTMLARDYARASKEAGATEAQVSYNRGYAEGYYKAATELAALIKEQELAPRPAQPQARPAAPAQPPTQQGGRRPGATPAANPPQQQRPAPAQTPSARPAPPAAPSEPRVSYGIISVGEALSVLEFAGCAARDVVLNKDNSFHAIFSRWENMMPHDRVERIKKADGRIVILNTGKTETQDHFVDFAFKES